MIVRRLLSAIAVLAFPMVLATPPADAQTATPPASPATTASSAPTKTPIKHFITLMQENHSFDNYFGTYPGADGIPAGTCMPVDLTDAAKGCTKPFRIGDLPITDLGHSRKVFDAQYNDRKLDGFVSAFTTEGIDGTLAMGHYDDRDLPYYWNVADNYVLFDRMFHSAAGGSVANHMFWIAGQPGSASAGESIPDAGFDVPTIFDRLQAAGLPWKFYVQSYDPGTTLYTRNTSDRPAQIVWAPLLAFPRYLSDPEFMSHIVPLSEYFTDLENNALPAVSYLVPSGASEHPPGSIQAGEAYVRNLISSLQRSSSWSSSAFMLTYDDWGGWYDHVVPPTVDFSGYGFRVPALLISPYAKKGFIDHSTLDFTSILKFIEENWTLEPLASRDRAASSFSTAFDFRKPPRPAVFLDRRRQPEVISAPKRKVVYLSYSAAAALPLVFIIGAMISRRRAAAQVVK